MVGLTTEKMPTKIASVPTQSRGQLEALCLGLQDKVVALERRVQELEDVIERSSTTSTYATNGTFTSDAEQCLGVQQVPSTSQNLLTTAVAEQVFSLPELKPC